MRYTRPLLNNMSIIMLQIIKPRENVYNVPIYEHQHVPLTTTSPVPDIATLYPYPPQDPISESNLHQTPVPTPSLVYGPPETETKKPVIHIETEQTDDRSDIPIEPQQVYGLPTDRSIETEAEIVQNSTSTKKDLRKKLYYNEHSSGKRTDFTGGASAPLELPQEIKSSNYENNFRSTSLRLPKGHSGLFHNTTKNESTTASENEESEQSNLGTVRAVYYKNFSISVIPDTSKFTTTETSVSGEDTTNKTIQTEKKTDESKAENITAIYSKQLEVLNNLNKEKLSQYSYFLPKQTDNGSRKWDMLNKYKIYYLNRVDSTEKSATKDFDHSIDTKLSNRPHAFYNAPISETPSPLNVHKFSPASSEMQKMSQFHQVAQDLKKMILNKAQTFSYSFTAKTPANQNNFKQSSGSLNQNHAFINSVVSKEKTRPATVYGPPLDVRYNANQGKSATPTYPKSTFSYSYTAKISNNHENSKQEHSSNSQKHSSNTYFKPAAVYGAPALDKAGPAISTRLPNLQKVSEFHKIAQNFKTMALNQAQTYNLNAKHQPTVGSSVSYSYTAKTSNNQENSKQEHSSNTHKHFSNAQFRPATVYGVPALDLHNGIPATPSPLPNIQQVYEFHKNAQNLKTTVLNQAQSSYKNSKHQPSVESSISYTYTAKSSNGQGNSKQEHSSNIQKHSFDDKIRPATIYGVPALDIQHSLNKGKYSISDTPTHLPNLQKVSEFHKVVQDLKTKVSNHQQVSYTSKTKETSSNVTPSFSYGFTAKSSTNQSHSKQQDLHKVDIEYKSKPLPVYSAPYAHYVTNNPISSTSADSKQENHQTSTVSYSYTAKAISNQHNLKQSVKISKPNTVYGVPPLEAQQNSLDFQRNEYKSHDSYVYPKPTDSLPNLSSQLHLPKSEQSVPFEYHPILNEKTNGFRKNHFFNKQTFYEIPFDSSTPHNSQHKKVLYKVVKRPLNNR
ncbi:hypothetical protein GWI33_020461 [Rhynchophorus ferrugineus]|uniref:Uncharacterized protein n=1 Tax=Rhynchophorus ferrugineus TaxID=354439 RepID=A0A834HRJ2_RHYFE|nr:hypothetical protein GWI33_020461 [Rhynchophorus ferrugineus]